MYVDMGNLAADAVTLDFSVAGTTADQWNVKVSQIPCSSNYRAPNKCVKYYTGASGTVTSYGFPGNTLLQNQNYESCIRQEAGYCSILWDQSTVTPPADAFDLTNAAMADQATNNVITACGKSFVKIPNAVLGPTSAPITAFCGEVFGVEAQTVANSFTSSTLPFTLSTFTGAGAANTLTTFDPVANGYSLDYVQQAC
ncbi:uncharacterized protein LOC111707648 [Eurytemora carolleeae]|uniref:uncharacterized protein LOC111707648 n=1 Tax=Eurytemora carolleeae TaxID=1294199 RepID=UPI000C783833|nr:uncharacterized protein LOC111707648 [Eurytemora carolleeae]|eukprot:XP_023336549.1 uncharacterized protein LOC111707648 [Eurytemora affinis]